MLVQLIVIASLMNVHTSIAGTNQCKNDIFPTTEAFNPYLKTKKLKQLFVNMYDFDMKSQQNLLDKTLLNWIKEGNTEQVDDILVIGFKA